MLPQLYLNKKQIKKGQINIKLYLARQLSLDDHNYLGEKKASPGNFLPHTLSLANSSYSSSRSKKAQDHPNTFQYFYCLTGIYNVPFIDLKT